MASAISSRQLGREPACHRHRRCKAEDESSSLTIFEVRTSPTMTTSTLSVLHLLHKSLTLGYNGRRKVQLESRSTDAEVTLAREIMRKVLARLADSKGRDQDAGTNLQVPWLPTACVVGCASRPLGRGHTDGNLHGKTATCVSSSAAKAAQSFSFVGFTLLFLGDTCIWSTEH